MATFLVATALAWRLRAVAGLLAAPPDRGERHRCDTCSAIAATAPAFTVAFAAFERGDIEAATEVLDPDVR